MCGGAATIARRILANSLRSKRIVLDQVQTDKTVLAFVLSIGLRQIYLPNITTVGTANINTFVNE